MKKIRDDQSANVLNKDRISGSYAKPHQTWGGGALGSPILRLRLENPTALVAEGRIPGWLWGFWHELLWKLAVLNTVSSVYWPFGFLLLWNSKICIFLYWLFGFELEQTIYKFSNATISLIILLPMSLLTPLLDFTLLIFFDRLRFLVYKVSNLLLLPFGTCTVWIYSENFLAS